MHRKLWTFAVVLSFAGSAATARAQNRPPPPELTQAQRNAAVEDQIERIVSRPNAINLTASQRRIVDSLKTQYLKESTRREKDSKDKATAMERMESAKEGLQMRLRYYDIIQNLMTPSQIPDFTTNRDQALLRDR